MKLAYLNNQITNTYIWFKNKNKNQFFLKNNYYKN